jgi:hypothetical protein
MEFYINNIEDYIINDQLYNELSKMSYLLEKSYVNECIYFGLFMFSTIMGVLICTLKEKQKEYIYIQQNENSNNK